jgi:hypothetical protein
MGTSTVHRSPPTARWRYVDAMYRDAHVDQRRLLSEVLNAGSIYVEGLSDAAVLVRLQSLLEADRSGVIGRDDPVQAATELVGEAQGIGRAQGYVSFYGDLADRALFATMVRGATEAALVVDSAAAVRSFARELIGFAVDHLVSRDVTAHLGEVSLPTASSLLALRGEVVESARALVDAAALTEHAAATVAMRPDAWRSLVAAAWEAGSDLGERE